jgi:MFS family permease
VPFDQLMGWFFILFSLAWILLGLAYAACIAIAGRCLSRRRNRAFCFVMAGISCGFFPFGTVLGVFTLLVLSRESVRALFPDGR